MELGRGAYGVVEKMRHVPSGQIMAVKVELTFPKHFLSAVCTFVHPQCKSAFFIEAKQSLKGGAENITCREQIALQMCRKYFLNITYYQLQIKITLIALKLFVCFLSHCWIF